MNKYRITNTGTGEVIEKEAEYLGTVIDETDWPPELCSCEIVPLKVDGQVLKPKAGRKKKTEKIPPADPDADRLRAIAQADQAAAEAAATAENKLKEEVDKIDIHAISSDASEAEKTAYGHKQEIETLAIGAEVMFLRMGQLLYDASAGAEWSTLHYESYREYVEDLKLPVQASYSWATRLSAIYEYLVKNMKIDDKILAEIGVAKLTRLLPLARKGELTMEVIEAARILSDLDLREELGQDVGGSGGDKVDNVVCPRCGNVFNQRKASRA